MQPELNRPALAAPEVVDLGALVGPLLVFGGPYGNLEATEALIGAAARLGIPPGRAICTGDVVAYSADPQGVCDRLRAWGCPIVMGNCEESLAGDADDCACGFGENSACAVLSVQWFACNRRDLDRETKRWMGTLPRRLRFSLGGRSFAAVHGAPSQINRFIFASTPRETKLAELDLAGTDAIVGGHCGLPFTQTLGRRLWHNAGAIGQPANDGTARVWFSVLTPRAGGIEIAHHALDYDRRAAAEKMGTRGYPAEYADSLANGLWPSCDILPPREVALRGRPIAPARVFWPSEALPAAAD